MMSDFYIYLSDFTNHADDFAHNGLVEEFASCLDTIISDETLANKIVPIFIVRGGPGEYSLEPIYFSYFAGIPFVFSTAYRLYGKDKDSIAESPDGGTFISDVFNYNNDNVYNLGSAYDMEHIDEALSPARNGNVSPDAQIDKSMLGTVIVDSNLSAIRTITLPNGGIIDVYALDGSSMDALQLDKNYSAEGRTISYSDNPDGIIYLIGVGGNPAVRNIGLVSGSDGFVYTAWTNNSPEYFTIAEEMLKYFPVDSIENDLTDMTSAIGSHILMHLRKNQLESDRECW